jgi:hypothetical protein
LSRKPPRINICRFNLGEECQISLVGVIELFTHSKTFPLKSTEALMTLSSVYPVEADPPMTKIVSNIPIDD